MCRASFLTSPALGMHRTDAEGVWGTVMSMDAWGDLYTNILPSDLQKLGIKHGEVRVS